VGKEEVKEKVRSFLEQMGIRVIIWDEEADRFVLPYDILGRDITVYVAFMEDYAWVVTVADVYDLSKLPKTVDKEEFFKKLLSDNFLRYKNRYGIDWNNHLVALAEMRADELNFENFRTSYEGVLNTVVNFIESVAKEFDIPV